MSKPNEVTVDHILDEFREIATSSRDLGYKFERLILGFLKTDPLYEDKFSNVWLWQDWPKRDNKPDTGIDLVAQERDTGDYCAIQCKFFDPDYCLDKKHIDSFFTASGREPFSSRMIVCTTDNWTRHAEDSIQKQQIPVTRLRLKDLADSPIDWGGFNPKHPDRIKLKPKKTLRPHQTEALEAVMEKFQESDRGKLIMACGTGKTFTSLKIAERFANQKGKAYVLFLVPSIALLSQTLREWSAEADVNLHSIAVCSDVKVGKKNTDSGDIDTRDLAYPATTDSDLIVKRTQASADEYDLTVVFSTYQSIQAIADAQQKGLPEFDLIICDEAHRTTGVTLQGQDESNFVGVHNQDFIQSKKRLYMTATPRLYGEATKTKAQENDATLCSMDDENLYGPEFHRLGFGEAVSRDLLTDYKVMVLAVDEKHVSTKFQYQLADENNELNLEDAVKITGCWNGLSKRMTDANGEPIKSDTNPMRSAVAFCNSINDSKKITRLFSEIVEEYQRSHPNEDILHCELDHVDGKHNSLERHQKLDWLKNDTRNQGEVCRILSNAKCLSEGVDVPALDAVMFLSPKNSMVDVVQSVGRVMRKAAGKDYGYIILPVGIPGDMSPQEALKDNKRYQVVWKVLQALRSHDDRFNAIVNQIELNEKRPSKIDVIGVGGDRGDDEDSSGGSSEPKVTQLNINFPQLEEWRDAIYGKIVSKCGDRYYWENWAKDVAKIANGHIFRIKSLLEQNDSETREAFDYFLSGLQQNINPKVTEDEAIKMLSQHLITKPIFDALFEQYQFTKYNPVSISMQKILNTLEKKSLDRETAKLEEFYDQVRERASGVDNAEGKQQIIIELYEKFFQNAFPRVSDRLGIVYTPVEIVDFILNSADYVLQQEFGAGLSNEGVHILDPFTGTGTFIVQLLKSGLIKPEDLERKFNSELHANEIVLLAYYIAAINIEETYHDLQGGEYKRFDGIVLTDTFQMFENTGTLNEAMFPENNQRVTRQKENSIKVVVANPPYSVGQNSENDSNKNLRYSEIDSRIQKSYVEYSSSISVSSLYNSYIRAIRWASDRIEEKGIVCYVTNGYFIDGKALDGLRKCLVDEFTSVYCFNLRGDNRTSGEQTRKEKGNVFGQGTRDPVAITLLIKNPNKENDNCVFYHDIGDYLSRRKKLDRISDLDSVANISWEKITPNAKCDWINKRDPAFDKFIPLGNKKIKNLKLYLSFTLQDY